MRIYCLAVRCSFTWIPFFVRVLSVVFVANLAFGNSYGDTPIQALQAYLKASHTEDGLPAEFGYSVAISGDTAVVGAKNEASNATGINGDQNNISALNSGAAYIFVYDGYDWAQQAYLKASNTGKTDWFGHSVAISGDTVVVGAILEDSSATGINGDQLDNGLSAAGAAYVFVRNEAEWSQQAYLKASNPGPGDRFGYSVGMSGGNYSGRFRAVG